MLFTSTPYRPASALTFDFSITFTDFNRFLSKTCSFRSNEMNSQTSGQVLMPIEAEASVESLKKFDVKDVGSTK